MKKTDILKDFHFPKETQLCNQEIIYIRKKWIRIRRKETDVSDGLIVYIESLK